MIARGSFTPISLSFLPSILFLAIHFFYGKFFLYISLILILFPLFTIIFFRDPDRKIGKGIVSPADGKIIKIDKKKNSLDIFMNLTDIHVNRSPVKGNIAEIESIKGKHNPAFLDSSEKNHKNRILLRTEKGNIVIWQIVGFLARRIVPYVQEGEVVDKGERIGMIRFGSRIKIEFPDQVEIKVEKGEKVRAGESNIGEWE